MKQKLQLTAARSERPNSLRLVIPIGYVANQIMRPLCAFLDVHKEFIFETKVITLKMEKLKNKLKL